MANPLSLDQEPTGDEQTDRDFIRDQAPKLAVTLHPDGSALLAALAELRSAMAHTPNIPLEVRDRLFDLFQRPAELFRLDIDRLPAAGAGEVHVRLYPSDRLLRLGFALRTGNFDFRIVEQHGDTSCGEGGELGQPAILPQERVPG